MQKLQLKLEHRESSIGQDSRLLKMLAAVQKGNFELSGVNADWWKIRTFPHYEKLIPIW